MSVVVRYRDGLRAGRVAEGSALIADAATAGRDDRPLPVRRAFCGLFLIVLSHADGRETYAASATVSADPVSCNREVTPGDGHSRAVLAWRLSNTLHADFCVEALEEALRRFGRPDIFNTDQGSQFTSTDFTDVLKTHGIKISMDGKGRFIDNIFVERLWRSLKYEEVYLHAYTSVPEAKAGIGAWPHFYNEERLHQTRGYRTPRQVYEAQCRWTWGRSAAPSSSASPTSRASSGCGGMLAFAPMPTGTNRNKDLEIEDVAVTLRPAFTSMPSIVQAP